MYKNVILYVLEKDEKWRQKMIIRNEEDINKVQWLKQVLSIKFNELLTKEIVILSWQKLWNFSSNFSAAFRFANFLDVPIPR